MVDLRKWLPFGAVPAAVSVAGVLLLTEATLSEIEAKDAPAPTQDRD